MIKKRENSILDYHYTAKKRFCQEQGFDTDKISKNFEKTVDKTELPCYNKSSKRSRALLSPSDKVCRLIFPHRKCGLVMHG
jgi:hypothetical protein